MSSGTVLRQTSGPTSYVKPIHYCKYPSVNGAYACETHGLGSVWECECGKQWIVMKDYTLNGNWRALWKTSNPFRRIMARRYDE